MEKLSRAALMSIGIIKSTLTQEDLEALAKAQAADFREHIPLDEKVGFELGWDYARFLGWHPDDETDKNFLGGFATAKKKSAVNSPVDRYTRKWLQLRYNAWKRNRVYDPDVTPEFIQIIDRPMCPVLRIALTHSTGELSDWSVDRLNNEGGYAIGNLAVISTKANAAKGALSFAQIEALSQSQQVEDGLTPLEWKRLLSLITGAYSVIQQKELLYPLCITPPPFVPLNFFQELQLALVKEGAKKPSVLMNELRKICPTKALARQLNKISQRVKHARQKDQPRMEIWLQAPLLDALKDFYVQLPQATLGQMRNLVEVELGSERVSDDMRQKWALDKKGFASN